MFKNLFATNTSKTKKRKIMKPIINIKIEMQTGIIKKK